MRFGQAAAMSNEGGIPSTGSVVRGGRCADAKMVLLVDDEETVREVGKEALQALGYSVSVARDGKEALGLYEKQSTDSMWCSWTWPCRVWTGGRSTIR